MKKYTVKHAFWHKGILKNEGESLDLTDSEAKHIRHLLNEAEDKGEAPEPSAQSAAEAEGASRPEEAPAPRDGVDPEAVAVQSKIVSAVKARHAKS